MARGGAGRGSHPLPRLLIGQGAGRDGCCWGRVGQSAVLVVGGGGEGHGHFLSIVTPQPRGLFGQAIGGTNRPIKPRL
jgi:hypothetical protein